VDAVTDTIEAKLLDIGRRELTTREIAATVLSALKHFNLAAFMRFLAHESNPHSPADLAREIKKYQ
jgi:transcriptional regulator NrdR family protein